MHFVHYMAHRVYAYCQEPDGFPAECKPDSSYEHCGRYPTATALYEDGEKQFCYVWLGDYSSSMEEPAYDCLELQCQHHP